MPNDKTPPAPPPAPDDEPVKPVEIILGGGGVRGEAAGCPSGLSLPSRRKKKDDETPVAPPDRTEGRGGKP